MERKPGRAAKERDNGKWVCKRRRRLKEFIAKYLETV